MRYGTKNSQSVTISWLCMRFTSVISGYCQPDKQFWSQGGRNCVFVHCCSGDDWTRATPVLTPLRATWQVCNQEQARSH